MKDDIPNKSKAAVAAKCNEIIDSLEDFNMAAKYQVVSSLYHTFLAAAADRGMHFIEVERADSSNYQHITDGDLNGR